MAQTTDRRVSDGQPSARRDDSSVRAYMEAFARALTAGDGAAIAQMWAVPALVMMKDGTARAVGSPDEVEKFFSGAKDQYTERGISEARPDIQRVEWLTDDVVVARVRWPYLDASGKEIGEESSVYTLRRDGSKLKMCAIVMLGAKEQGH